MPLSKQAKALYEAALKRKGLQPGKAVRQDPRTFVGPIRTVPVEMPSPRRTKDDETLMDIVQAPADTYYRGRGRLQDLEDELNAAEMAGLWQRKNPVRTEYRDYFDKHKQAPYYFERWGSKGSYNDQDDYRWVAPYDYFPEWPYYSRRRYTRLGELDLESKMDEAVENEYKSYLKSMMNRFPTRAEAEREYTDRLRNLDELRTRYLDELYPVK